MQEVVADQDSLLWTSPPSAPWVFCSGDTVTQQQKGRTGEGKPDLLQPMGAASGRLRFYAAFVSFLAISPACAARSNREAGSFVEMETLKQHLFHILR